MFVRCRQSRLERRPGPPAERAAATSLRASGRRRSRTSSARSARPSRPAAFSGHSTSSTEPAAPAGRAGRGRRVRPGDAAGRGRSDDVAALPAGTARSTCRSGCAPDPTCPSAASNPPTSVVLPAPSSPDSVTSNGRSARRRSSARARRAPSARISSAPRRDVLVIAADSRRRAPGSMTSLASMPRSPAARGAIAGAGVHEHAGPRGEREIAALRGDARDHAREHVAHAGGGHAGIAAIADASAPPPAICTIEPAPFSTTTPP